LTRIKLLFVLFLIIFTGKSFCQLESLKWTKQEISYTKSDHFKPHNYSFQSDDAGEFMKKSFVNAYWFFISDVDGDNCPFRPSCSTFFIDATEETNIFQGTLMFSDRLMRDFNPFKNYHYPLDKSGHYYDPSINYTLSSQKIKYLPPTFIVEDE
jgi:putative component of membrane protein insertase Oxa1/YidC/SpoIIIJ protein YidD